MEGRGAVTGLVNDIIGWTVIAIALIAGAAAFHASGLLAAGSHCDDYHYDPMGSVTGAGWKMCYRNDGPYSWRQPW